MHAPRLGRAKELATCGQLPSRLLLRAFDLNVERCQAGWAEAWPVALRELAHPLFVQFPMECTEFLTEFVLRHVMNQGAGHAMGFADLDRRGELGFQYGLTLI